MHRKIVERIEVISHRSFVCNGLFHSDMCKPIVGRGFGLFSVLFLVYCSFECIFIGAFSLVLMIKTRKGCNDSHPVRSINSEFLACFSLNDIFSTVDTH